MLKINKRKNCEYMKCYMKNYRARSNLLAEMLNTDTLVANKKLLNIKDHLDSDNTSENEEFNSPDTYKDVDSNSMQNDTASLHLYDEECILEPDDVSPVYSSEDEIKITFKETIFEFLTKFAQWAIESRLPREKINELLKILDNCGRFNKGDIPKDARALLHTPRTVNTVQTSGGHFGYFGLEKSLIQKNLSLPFIFKDQTVLKLNINIDGVPIHRSSNLQFWPILCAFHGINTTPFVIAIFSGYRKPLNINEYLEQFIDEINFLQKNSMVVDGKIYEIKLNAFICDAPARAFVKYVSGHTSKQGCERCTCEGQSVERRIIFSNAGESRTDSLFRLRQYPKHYLSKSPALNIDHFDVIKGFPLESMHLLFLGVCRRYLMFLKTGPRNVRLSHAQLNTISLGLTELSQYTPSDFMRRPHSLFEVDRWKATEFRQLVLYTGILIFKGVLNDQHYDLFKSFFIAVRILHIDNDEYLLGFARCLFQSFVYNAKILCGETFLTYNVHNLLHIVDDVEYFRCSLSYLSSFPFENFLQCLKRTVRDAKTNPLTSCTKRFFKASQIQLST
ncbi:uncharacterized protein LOC124806599 [Hydra vulgaris]|uniref:uncharacterized protein LOC124806599 n=1 Tax=Hydra vulgaris TaxID=6087 RepID=UPI001F5F9966|nr:uncharacterized protein LOC124806599 isoform X1 [Hydra vulgaris]